MVRSVGGCSSGVRLRRSGNTRRLEHQFALGLFPALPNCWQALIFAGGGSWPFAAVEVSNRLDLAKIESHEATEVLRYGGSKETQVALRAAKEASIELLDFS